jgi:uncharacterized protein (TIGR02246 family)
VRMPALLPALSMGLFASPLLAQAAATRPTPTQEREILAVYRQLLNADAQRDTATLKRILAPGYTFVPPRGDTIFTREERLANTVSDTSTNRPRYTLHSCRTQMHGEVAVAHCRYSATFRAPGASSDSTRGAVSTAVFVQQGKQWLIAATHPSMVRRQSADSAVSR